MPQERADFHYHVFVNSVFTQLNQTGDLESEDLEYVLSALTKDAEGGTDELSFLLNRQTSCQ